MSDKWKSIDGWLADNEAEMLQKFAIDKICLELGAYKGKSTIAMADNAKYLFTIDPFSFISEVCYDINSPDYLGQHQSREFTTLNEFKNNTREYDNIFPFIGTSTDVVPFFFDNTFDVIFIDAIHDYENAIKDTRCVWNKLKMGGVIIYHDWDWGDGGVGRGIKSLFSDDEIGYDEALRYIIKKKYSI